MSSARPLKDSKCADKSIRTTKMNPLNCVELKFQQKISWLLSWLVDCFFFLYRWRRWSITMGRLRFTSKHFQKNSNCHSVSANEWNRIVVEPANAHERLPYCDAKSMHSTLFIGQHSILLFNNGTMILLFSFFHSFIHFSLDRHTETSIHLQRINKWNGSEIAFNS